METLDLAFVSDRTGPWYPGGYERHVWTLARELARHHRVRIYTSLPSARAVVDNVEFLRISPYWSYVRAGGTHSIPKSAAFAASLGARIPRLGRMDFVNVEGIPYAHLLPFRARQLFSGVRWGVTIWEAWWDYPSGPGWHDTAVRWGTRSLLGIAVLGRHSLLVGSEVTERALAQRHQIQPGRVHRVHPGIDLDPIRSAPLDPDGPEIVAVGRLEPYKRIDDLLRALRALRDRGRFARTIIAGDGPERRRLEALARDLELGDLVRFRGRVSEEEKYALLKSASVYVLASDREGFSIATLEAMASGCCPIVARPASPELFGVSELVADGVTGLAYPARQPVALADRIVELIEDPVRRGELAGRARAFAEEFTLTASARQYREAIGHAG